MIAATTSSMIERGIDISALLHLGALFQTRSAKTSTEMFQALGASLVGLVKFLLDRKELEDHSQRPRFGSVDEDEIKENPRTVSEFADLPNLSKVGEQGKSPQIALSYMENMLRQDVSIPGREGLRRGLLFIWRVKMVDPKSQDYYETWAQILPRQTCTEGHRGLLCDRTSIGMCWVFWTARKTRCMSWTRSIKANIRKWMTYRLGHLGS